MNLSSPVDFSQRAFTHTANVVDRIGLGIVAGEYPEKTMIPLDPDLEEMFGVSRTVIREAKKTLVGKGLLESKAKVGTRVRPSSDWNMFDADVLRWYTSLRNNRDFLAELVDVRLIFEPAAAERVARRGDPADAAILRQACEALLGAKSRHEFALIDLEFHKTILRLSGNRFLQSLGDIVQITLYSLLEKETRPGDFDILPERLSDSAARHVEIVEAIAARAPRRAHKAMARVILESRSRLHE